MSGNLEMADKQCRLNNIVNKISENRMMKNSEYDPNYIRDHAFGEDVRFIKPLDDEDFEMQSVILNEPNQNHLLTYHDMDVNNAPGYNLNKPQEQRNEEMQEQEMESLKQEVAEEVPPTGAPGENWPNDLKMEELHIQDPQTPAYNNPRVYCHMSY